MDHYECEDFCTISSYMVIKINIVFQAAERSHFKAEILDIWSVFTTLYSSLVSILYSHTYVLDTF